MSGDRESATPMQGAHGIEAERAGVAAPHLLDYEDLARVLRLRLRGRAGGFSAAAARALVNRHAELRALAIHLAPRKPRWRCADVLAWMEQHASVVVAGCPDCRRKVPRTDEPVFGGERS